MNPTDSFAPRTVLLTGISGSGKSVALHVLEDEGFYCIDNLPAPFVQDVIQSLHGAGYPRVAIAIDVRSGPAPQDLPRIVADLKRQAGHVTVLFLNARTDVLIQRFSETRRRHPLGMPVSQTDGLRAANETDPPTLIEAIERERELMSQAEGLGPSIDTSELHPNVLRQWVRDVTGLKAARLTLLFESFAFKHGVPLTADLVFDMRCLPNPYYTPALRALNGTDEPVVRFLSEVPAVQRMVDHVEHFVQSWLPSYAQENRSYLTVAIGCTGGQHRSVYVASELARRFSVSEQVLVRHRNLAHKMLVAS
ncbi:MAG: RNase adapter RapZ [Burkholderiaceae bacterium]